MDFPPSYIVDPTHDVAHSHTIILLHGRGSTAREFANDLFLLKTSKQGGNLRDTFPSVRWVFPDAGQRWCTVFQEKRSAWFDTASLDDLSLSQDLQLPGLCNGIQLAAKIMESEVDRLGGRSDHVILGGFSQGSAVALWSLFTGVAGLKGCLGAFVGFSAWMPFTKEAMDFITSGTQESVPSRYGALREGFGKILEAGWTASIPSVQIAAGMPVYLGHGVDDALIGIDNCYQLSTIFTAVGAVVHIGEYAGADREGHWIKEPEQLDDIVAFIGRVFHELG